jgi:hypothetical protein
MEIRQVGAKLFYANGGSGGPTDMMKLFEILQTRLKSQCPLVRPFYQYEAVYSTGHSSTLSAPRQEEKSRRLSVISLSDFRPGANDVSLFRDATQRRSVVSYRRFGSTNCPIFRGQTVQYCLDRLTPALIPEKRRPEILSICVNMPLRRGTRGLYQITII